MKVPFSKMSGAGNDFVLLNDLPHRRSGSTLAKRLCDRRRGIGADGLIVLSLRHGHIRLDYWNADGSPAFCANGARCGALWSSAKGWAKKPRFTIETCRGPLVVSLTQKDRAAIEMPRPKKLRLHLLLEVSRQTFNVHSVDTGAPHAVIFVPNLEKIDVKTIGRALRFHKAFGRHGANINFARIQQGAVHLRTYERGVEDETLACGTGAVAVTAVARALGKTEDHTAVQTCGGDILRVSFSKIRTWLEGPGKIVFNGEVNL